MRCLVAIFIIMAWACVSESGEIVQENFEDNGQRLEFWNLFELRQVGVSIDSFYENVNPDSPISCLMMFRIPRDDVVAYLATGTGVFIEEREQIDFGLDTRMGLQLKFDRYIDFLGEYRYTYHDIEPKLEEIHGHSILMGLGFDF